MLYLIQEVGGCLALPEPSLNFPLLGETLVQNTFSQIRREGCLFWHFRILESVMIQKQCVLMFHLSCATVTFGWLLLCFVRCTPKNDVRAWGAGGRHWGFSVCWAASLSVLGRLRDRQWLFISMYDIKYTSIPKEQLCIKLGITVEISGSLRKCCSQGTQLLVLTVPCAVPCQLMSGISACTGVRTVPVPGYLQVCKSFQAVRREGAFFLQLSLL